MTRSLPELIDEAAERLFQARSSRTAIEPVRHRLAPKDVDAAYAVQRINVERLVDAGCRRVGRKIGLTSAAVQRQLGVDQPDFGVLFDVMDYGREAFCVSSLISPRIEAELAFQIGRDITSERMPASRLASHVDAVCVAIEIVDSAIAGWDIDIVDTVADNASCGGFVLGGWQAFHPELDLPARRMGLRRNGQDISSGSGAATLGDPLNALAWLADVSVRRGDPLRAGEVVLAGALGPMRDLVPGDYVAEVDGFPLLFARAAP